MDIGEIEAIVFDFDGVLTDNRVYIDSSGNEMVCCNRADGLAFDVLRRLPFKVFILSTEINPVVSKRAEKLRVPVYHGEGDKLEKLKQLSKEEGFDLGKTIYIGNDINDLRAMSACGFPVCPADGHDRIMETAKFKLRTRGGDGSR